MASLTGEEFMEQVVPIHDEIYSTKRERVNGVPSLNCEMSALINFNLTIKSLRSVNEHDKTN